MSCGLCGGPDTTGHNCPGMRNPKTTSDGYRGSVNVLGSCSLCGGQVTTPVTWMGINPPEPMCSSCGAVRRPIGPVIDMVKR